jgi:hypothetical protein
LYHISYLDTVFKTSNTITSNPNPHNPTILLIHLVLPSLPPRSKTIIKQMEKSILPPLHINTKAATTVRIPSAVFTLVVVWIEAFVTSPHFFCEEC